MQIKGLIDCDSEAQFEDQCYSCYRKWDTLESSNIESVIPQFSSYFKTYIEQNMKQGALLFKRRLAGLGDNFVYNNSTESVNFCFKNKIREKNLYLKHRANLHQNVVLQKLLIFIRKC